MSQPVPLTANTAVPLPASRPDAVRGAIARAAQATGQDFGYLVAQARIESSLDPSARAATSSAAGLYQFTRGTWLNTLDRHGAAHGLGWAGDAIEGGRITDPRMAAQVMALRFDPEASARMAAELASDNRAALLPVLGREPDPAELYLAHFLGAEGASKFLGQLASDPMQSAAALMPAAAAANRGIFYNGRTPRSVGEVMALVRDKVTSAMGAEGAMPMPGPMPGQVLGPGGFGWPPQMAGAPWAAPTASAGLPEGSTQPVQQRPSMAETLAAAFGTDRAAPAVARAAYSKLRAFGL